jgi:serine O-acetyltransferase
MCWRRLQKTTESSARLQTEESLPQSGGQIKSVPTGIATVKDLIESRDDYEFYLEADRIALLSPVACALYKRPPLRFSLACEIWKFQRLLRKVEFLHNCGKGQLSRISYFRAWRNFEKSSMKLGFTIPPNVFGPGLSIVHRGTIVVNSDSKVGENCRLYHCVTIGSGREMPNDSPSIGNNVFVGTGVVIVGPITIADGIVIGANSYVNKSFTEPNITIAGCPAKKVSNRSSEGLWIRATEILRKDYNSR